MFAFKEFDKHIHLITKIRSIPKGVTIDNWIFKLHYRVTFWFLLYCTVMVSSRQFMKNHIDCISDASVKQVINSFCFFSTTFTVTRLQNDSYLPGVHKAYPGVGPASQTDEKTYHAYYQWVPFVLGAQALLFYAPHYFWKRQERGRIRAIVDNGKISPFVDEVESIVQGYRIDSFQSRERRENLIETIYLNWARMKLNRDWTVWLVLSEVLNLLNLVTQIVLVDYFLQGNFITLGTRWLADEEVLDIVFPKMTKCTFRKYGKSGSLQTHDALCVMSLNIINEKVYATMWFWFGALLLLSLGGLAWRMVGFLRHADPPFSAAVLSEASPGPPLRPAEVRPVARWLTFSDWLVLVYIAKNMEPGMFRSTVAALSRAIDRSRPLISGNDKSYIDAPV